MTFLTFTDLHDMIKDTLKKETLRDLSVSGKEKFAKKLLPPDMYILCRSAEFTAADLFLPDGKEKAPEELDKLSQKVSGQSRTTFNYFSKNEGSGNRYTEIARLLFVKNQENNQYYSYENCQRRIEIEDAWNEIIEALSPAEQKDLSDTLKGNIEYITKSRPDIKKRLEALYSKSLPACLASLTLIASTISYFENEFDSPETGILKLMFLPRNEEAETDLALVRNCRDKAKRTAAGLLSECSGLKSSIEADDKAARDCYNRCMKILALEFLEDPAILGEANYILYLCHRKRLYAGQGDKTAYKYFEESCRYSYPEAIAAWKETENFKLSFHAEAGTSKERGVCIKNCDNRFTELFKNTIPHEHWSLEEFQAEDPDQALGLYQKKYLFFSDNYAENLADTMKLIDAIRDSKNYLVTEYIEIYIRCEEEKYGPLIDTAQNCLDNHFIKIYLLDDDKFAAQYLLSHHPLFYPIRSFIRKSEKSNIPLLNFVVIGSDKTAEWLVREAFWLQTFLPGEVSTKITILAPDAERLYTDIITGCPGLRKDNKAVSGLFKGKIVYEIEPRNVNFSSCELENAIDTLQNTESYLYFAVSAGTDTENLALSIRLREQLIRNSIIGAPESESGISQAQAALFSLPPIAFKCTDPDISELGSHLVVSNIQYGNSWYNNYALIPFGSLSNRYTWNELDGGLIEKYALCTHLEYSDIPVVKPDDCAEEDYRQQRKAAIGSYFSRQYNKDSSFAMALSLPYRLFSMYSRTGKRLSFPSWNILDKDAYYEEKELASFAKDAERFLNLEDDSEDIIRLSEWEQIRWSRYMLSRGWMPVSPTLTKIYVGSEYTKHQLYVARLHPAICDFERLKEVEDELGKSFRIYNIRNLKRTSLILETAWLEQEREIETPVPEIQ